MPTKTDVAQENKVEQQTSLRSVLGGGSALTLATLLANAGNYVLNLLLGRWLTPAEFADANLMVTLMLLVTAIAVSLQLLGAHYVGAAVAKDSFEDSDAIMSTLARFSLWAGVALGALIALPAVVWSDIFKTESAWPFVVLGVGMPFYLVQSVGRGVLLGHLIYRPLALTFIVEMVARVAAGLLLVALGFGVTGATVGLTLSFIATWGSTQIILKRAGHLVKRRLSMTKAQRQALYSYIGPLALLLIGQIIINNGDVLIVKGSFDATDAGIYAAVALIGRAVFFLSWSVVNALFPAVTQREEGGHSSKQLLLGGTGVVAVMCLAMTAGAWLLGDWFFTGFFGPEFEGTSSLLTKYALATSLFAVANVIVTLQLSSGRIKEVAVLVAGGVVQTLLLFIMKDSANSVINAQLIAMFLLLLAVVYTSRSTIVGSTSPQR